MIPYLSAIFLTAGFLGVARVCRLVPQAESAVETAKSAVSVVRSPVLDDEAKEVALQRHAKELFVSFLGLTIGGAAAVGLPIGLLWLLERAKVGTVSSAVSTAISPLFLIATSLVVLIAFVWSRRRS